jgi:hypothetical protein
MVNLRSQWLIVGTLASASCGGAAVTSPTESTIATAPAAAPSPAEAAPSAQVATPTHAAPPPAPVVPVPASSITVDVLPATVWIERTDNGLLLNCDLVVENASQASFELVEIEASVFDRSDALVFRKLVSANGVSPAIATVADRALGPKQRRLVMNPLHTFPRDLDLVRVAFQLTYQRSDSEQQLVVSSEVTPRAWTGKGRLRLPLRDRVIAWSGHDYLSHHRRWDYLDPRIVELGFDSNAGRYSYDLIMVDASGAMRSGDPERNESWFGFGRPVVAPADGTVVGVVSDQPDDRKFDITAVKSELLVVFGNRVLIEHGPGEVSLLAHLRQGSVKVKVGDRVRAGQEIAAIGASGSSLMPHLHYQLQTTATGHAEGLPPTFHDFLRVRGARRLAVTRGTIETGEIVEPRRR